MGLSGTSAIALGFGFGSASLPKRSLIFSGMLWLATTTVGLDTAS
ncbi:MULTISPECIES: hypothetical protein [Trichocoleus]|nr:hypothetical protein [Trichocoleus sp. FACHB-46]